MSMNMDYVKVTMEWLKAVYSACEEVTHGVSDMKACEKYNLDVAQFNALVNSRKKCFKRPEPLDCGLDLDKSTVDSQILTSKNTMYLNFLSKLHGHKVLLAPRDLEETVLFIYDTWLSSCDHRGYYTIIGKYFAERNILSLCRDLGISPTTFNRILNIELEKFRSPLLLKCCDNGLEYTKNLWASGASTRYGLNSDIGDLIVSTRTCNALRASGINTIGDFLLFLDKEQSNEAIIKRLKSIRNIGEYTAEFLLDRYLAIREGIGVGIS